MVAKVWQQEIKRQNCLSQNTDFAQGVGGSSGFFSAFVVFLMAGSKFNYLISKICLVLGLD